MLADETQHGPGCILDKLRIWAGMKYDAFSLPMTEPGSLAEGLTCINCNSTWIGLAFVILLVVSPAVAFYASLPFAFSTLAIAVNGYMTKEG